ncbi:MAG TPA: VOC family protein [Candidatus Limnocylindrales bacterium]
MASFPEPEAEPTQILVVSDIAAARTWYADVLGAELYREYAGTSVVLRFNGAWLLLVTGGPPTADKPDVTFAAPTDRTVVGPANTIRVADCRGVHAELERRGAVFLTPPIESEWEIRAFLRDPDGHLWEISQVKS